ncbi:metal ABC transporter substrate-binding protein [Microbacterium sorbitolivorans]|uniref:Metal ABC transporter substrate-binding protein n=1 Tax=Microbacterium sorbitolivorans TaxID=1867410 RepID=A0A367XT83_9MICO|nr:zinc ABC transporter substrate-binding protein [Microbacterium sorbitolivorans]RCK56784.1 metal ABC transporter substrate-binding protein [Microbacterium sorbitolivorans]GGF50207.1 metal ABC transporter substrate-binding protein [Microbacterium sorbitolivorans]
MRTRRILTPVAVAALPALALAGCSSTGDDATASGDSTFQIVTSTSVYADIAKQIVGDAANVEAVIDSASVDPHDYEATARDGLTVQDADLAIMNGGGYDQFMENLLDSADVPHVMNVVEYSDAYPGEDGEEHDHDHDHDHAEEEDGHDHIEGFNEHVWYDPHTIEHFTEALRDELVELIPDSKDEIEAGAQSVLDQAAALEDKLEAIAADHTGDTAFFTEPVGAYFTEAAGLTDVTTEGFAEAVEHGEDVAPATLNAAIKSIEGGEVTVLVANAQTGGSETERVIQAAEGASVPVLEFTETIPDGDGFFGWMNDNADALAAAL